MKKHKWSREIRNRTIGPVYGIRTCLTCDLWSGKTVREPGGFSVEVFSDDMGKTWWPKRPECGTKLERTEEPAKRTVAEDGTRLTKHGSKIYDVKIKLMSGHWHVLGVGFEDQKNEGIKIQLHALPITPLWDGELYLFPRKEKQ